MRGVFHRLFRIIRAHYNYWRLGPLEIPERVVEPVEVSGRLVVSNTHGDDPPTHIRIYEQPTRPLDTRWEMSRDRFNPGNNTAWSNSL